MTTTLILMAAGRTEWDDARRIQGTLQVPLSDDGQAQVRAESARLVELRPKVVYAGETLCASQTADILGQELNVRVRLVAELGEVGYGQWQGLLIDEIQSRHPKAYRRWLENPLAVCPPDSEPMDAAQQRIEKALRAVVKRHSGQTVVVVCPRTTLALARSWLSGEAVDGPWTGEDRCGTWEVFQAGD